MNSNRTKQLVLCVLLSVLVHAGLAATFVNALRHTPAQLEHIRPIQVSLIQDNLNTVGDSAFDSDGPVSDQSVVESQVKVEAVDSENNFNQVNLEARDASPVNFSAIEGEFSRQETETVATVENPVEKSAGTKKPIHPIHRIETVDEIINHEVAVSAAILPVEPRYTEETMSTAATADYAAKVDRPIDESDNTALQLNSLPETIADLTPPVSAEPVKSNSGAESILFEPVTAEPVNLVNVAEINVALPSVDPEFDLSAVVELPTTPELPPTTKQPPKNTQSFEASQPSKQEAKTDWDQLVQALPPNFDELHEPIPVEEEHSPSAVAQTTSSRTSQIEFVDFDGEFARWTKTEQEPDATFEQSRPPKSMVQIEKRALSNEFEADHIAGLLPHPEIPVDISSGSTAPADEIDVTDTVFIEPEIQIASLIDLDAQIPQLAWPESDVPAVTESDLTRQISPVEQNTTAAKKGLKKPDRNLLVRTALQTQFESEPETIVESKPMSTQTDTNLPIKADADQLAGILPQPELLEDVAVKLLSPSSEINAGDVAPVDWGLEVIAEVDFDAQVQQLAWSEFEEITVSQPEIPAEQEPVAPLATNNNEELIESLVPQAIEVDETALAKADEPNLKADEQNVPPKQSKDRSLSLSENEMHAVQTAAVSEAAPKTNQDLKRDPDKAISASAQTVPQTLPRDTQQQSDKSQQQAALGGASQESKPRFGVRGLPNPAPRYPHKSRAKGEQGKVVLRVVVNRKGRADEVTVVQSSGYARLDKAARKAVRKWKFQPAQKHGRSTRGVVQVPISFVLENS